MRRLHKRKKEITGSMMRGENGNIKLLKEVKQKDIVHPCTATEALYRLYCP